MDKWAIEIKSLLYQTLPFCVKYSGGRPPVDEEALQGIIYGLISYMRSMIKKGYIAGYMRAGFEENPLIEDVDERERVKLSVKCDAEDNFLRFEKDI